ncbi:MAG: inorganic phosphate transporter [Micrococcaceae bacterium]
MSQALLGISLGLLVVFAAINGAHDASNTIASAVKTRALTPAIAIRLTSIFALIGALAGGFLWPNIPIGVHQDWVQLPAGVGGPIIIICVVVSAFVWDLLTLLLRMPSSSTHALFGAIAGASWASIIAVRSENTTIDLNAVLWEVILPLLLLPVLSFFLALACALAVAYWAQDEQPHKMNRRLRLTQSIATATLALTHAIATAQRLGFLGWLAIKSVEGKLHHEAIPVALILALALSFAIGTFSGGWRITDTLSNRLVPLDPLKGSIAQILPAIMYVVASLLQAPASSTQLFTTALVGSGTVPRWKAVNTNVVTKILTIWILTPFVTFLASALLYLAISNFL